VRSLVVAVYVVRSLVDPGDPAVDEEVDLRDLRRRQCRQRDPVDPMGKDRLPVEGRVPRTKVTATKPASVLFMSLLSVGA
jgi:hypothetical protein